MGSRAQVSVYYGLWYEAESADAEKFAVGGRDPERTETDPAALAYWGSRTPVEVVDGGHHDLPSRGLAAPGTVRRGYGWQPVDLSVLVVPDGADELLRAYCQTHGLTWHPPRWLALPYYG